jgi:hypothetical protein
MIKIEAMLLVIGLICVVSFLMSWPVMVLWNECLFGAVTGINQIGWMQAWGISLLCGFLFKTNVNTK